MTDIAERLERGEFEAWHNEFYGPQGDKLARSLAYDTFDVGLGYDDPVVQAQFCAFKGGQAARRALAEDNWYCEEHPQHLMGHDGCKGAGIPECARIPMFLHIIRLLKQEVREASRFRDDAVAQARLSMRAPAEAGVPTYQCEHVRVKQMRDGNIMVTMIAKGFESAQRYAVQPINPAVVRAAAPASPKQEPETNYPAHPFAIVVDRAYEGEGPTLAVWNGENYSFSDGDCYEREADGTLDGFEAEWLTHHQLEQCMLASAPEQWRLVLNRAISIIRTNAAVLRDSHTLDEVRDTMKRLLGDRYRERMDELGGALQKIAARKGKDVLMTAKEICSDPGMTGMEIGQIMAAAVELLEPTQ